VLVFMLWSPLLQRIVRISKRHNITSIADFVGAATGRLNNRDAITGIAWSACCRNRAPAQGRRVWIRSAVGTAPSGRIDVFDKRDAHRCDARPLRFCSAHAKC
jgi:hypothetical protein